MTYDSAIPADLMTSLDGVVPPAAPSPPDVVRPRNGDIRVRAHGGASEQSKPSIALELLRLVEEKYRLGRSEDGRPFAVAQDRTHRAVMLRGHGGLRWELAATYYDRTGRVATQSALADVLAVCEGQASRRRPEKVFLRVAQNHGQLWLDLADEDDRVIKVTANGWQMLRSAPMLFERTPLVGPLPTPESGGVLDDLWRVLNVATSYQPVLVAWLVAALFPDISHPVLALTGEQGTGKSTATRTLAALVDPSPAQIRKMPRDLETWVTAAGGSWVVALDNVSSVPEWLSDAMCRTVTGESDVRRRLYTDGDLVVFSFRRVLMLNGIDLGTLRDDLADRLVLVVLQPIEERARQTESDLHAELLRLRPRLLAAILDIASQVLETMGRISLPGRPRMADFACILAAVDQVLGTSGLDVYRGLRGELASDVVTSDPALVMITQRIEEDWTGTSSQLLDAITPRETDWHRPAGWPRTSRDLTSVLRRRAPSLRSMGWTVEDLGRGGRAKAVRFRLVPPNS